MRPYSFSKNLQIPTVTTESKHLATVVRNNFLLTGRNLKKRLGEKVGGKVPQEREREREFHSNNNDKNCYGNEGLTSYDNICKY